MKISKQRTVPLLLFFSVFTFGSFAQKAALYSFDFQVPEKYRREIQVYDLAGNEKYKKDPYSDKMILDKDVETLSKKEVNTVCVMVAEMFKRKFGYAQVKIMYPLKGYAGFNGLNDFPSLSLKKAVKKLTVDSYIAMEIHIEEMEPFLQGSDVLEILNIDDVERIMFFDFSAKYIIYDAKKKVIDQGHLTLPDIKDALNSYFAGYNKEVDEKGRYKLWKPYFTKEDIKSIYKISEQKLEGAE